MSDDQQERPDDAAKHGAGSQDQRSVLKIIEQKIGAAPHVSLHEGDSGGGASPIIDPRSEEKQALPRGRGNYHFSGEIARGGMGVVIKGHDDDLGRDIAVKILNKDLTQRPEALQRFIEEAQIGGQLQHPGIVPVYELGLMADERPYFTMKLVKGRTLAHHFEERKSPGTDRSRFLDVFESICQTLAYAHSRGVIHRDLKPANVMLGAFGEVQVVDWGLAKVLSRGGTADERMAREAQTVQTVLETVRSDGSGSGTDSIVGSVMGTPPYMPPEQASGLVDQLDERSDVFSLGAILCELLTGLPPYVGKQEEIIVAAARGRLDDAHARLDACGADLELIELTKECLLAAPAARPRHAGLVAGRIHEYIASVEERAHAARIDAAVQRKARKLTAALAATVLLAGLGSGAAWISIQGERSARQLEDAARQRELAEQVNENLSEAALLRGQARWAEARAAGERAKVLAVADEAEEELRARVEEVLAGIEAEHQLALDQEARKRDTTALLAELAEIRLPEGAIDWAQVSADYAAPFLSHGLNVDGGDVREVADVFTERGLGAEVALVLDAWTRARRGGGDEEGALRLLELAHLIDDDPRRGDLREAIINEDAGMLRALAEIAVEDQPPTTLHLLATALDRGGDREAALRVYRAGLLEHPDSFMLQASAGSLLEDGTAAELEEAVQCYSAAAVLRPETVEVRHRLGYVLNELDRYGLAARAFEEALDRRPDDGLLLYRLGWSVLHMEDHDRALSLFERSLESAGGMWWEAVLNDYYARALREVGQPERALPHAELAVQLRPNISQYQNDLGFARQDVGDLRGAEAAHRQACRVSPTLRSGFVHLGRVQRRMGKFEEAGASLARALELSPEYTYGHVQRGMLRWDVGDFDGAAEDFRRGIEFHSDSIGPFLALALLHATCARKDLYDPREAVRLAELALRKSDGDKYAFCILGIARYRSGDSPGALHALQRWADHGPVYQFARDAEIDLLGRLYLALVLQHSGKESEARREHERALEHRQRTSLNESRAQAFAELQLEVENAFEK